MKKERRPLPLALLSLLPVLVSSCNFNPIVPATLSPTDRVILTYGFPSEGTPSPHFRFSLGQLNYNYLNPRPADIDALMFFDCWIDWAFLEKTIDLETEVAPSLELYRVFYDESGQKLDEQRISNFGNLAQFPSRVHFDPDWRYNLCSLVTDPLAFEEIGYVPAYIEYGVVLVAGPNEWKLSGLLPGLVKDARYLRFEESDWKGWSFHFVDGIGGEAVGVEEDALYAEVEVPSLWIPSASEEE